MEPLLLTFTVPGLGAVVRTTGIPLLFSRSYVTLCTTVPLGKVNAKPMVPVLAFEVTVGPPPLFVFALDGAPVGTSLLEHWTRLVTPAHSVAAAATIRTAGFILLANISRRLQMGALRQDADPPSSRLEFVANSPRIAAVYRAFTEPGRAAEATDFRREDFDFRI
jgi:hypothetical protein